MPTRRLFLSIVMEKATDQPEMIDREVLGFGFVSFLGSRKPKTDGR